MARTAQDVTEAELAIMRILWERGSTTIRVLTGAIYGDDGASAYATIQKLLDRLESKGFVRRDRSAGVHQFVATIDRDTLIGRRLKAVADTLCDGSLTPLLSHLARADGLTEADRKMLRDLIDRVEA